MEFTEVVRRRRMVRSFSGRPVPEPLLRQLLDAALRAPSAGNTGGWDAVVLQGRPDLSVFWEATTTARWRAESRRWPGLERAPAAVVLFSRPAAYAERYAEPDKEASGLAAGPWPVPYWFVDAGFPALLLLLGAVDAGLAACFLGNFRGEEALARALGVPDDRRYVGTVLLGEPGDPDPPSLSLARGRRRAEDVVHWARWDAGRDGAGGDGGDGAGDAAGPVTPRSGPTDGAGNRVSPADGESTSAPGGQPGPDDGDP
jgi:nitroreductase